MTDSTESFRRQQQVEINNNPSDRSTLEAKYGQVWNTSEMTKDYDVVGFMSPYVVVRRKTDGLEGSLMFQHNPRLYFNFAPYEDSDED